MNSLPLGGVGPVVLADGVVLLPGKASAEALLAAVKDVLHQAPPKHYLAPWGKPMSVGMTNCGEIGWVSGSDGYSYSDSEPETGRRWPAMPDALRHAAADGALEAGFGDFVPDACLVNVYGPNSRMGLHQDRDEPDLSHPIVSVSLGRSARFRFGATRRTGPTRSIILNHGDVLVFGGAARLMFHGIDRLVGPSHPVLGDSRINLTFRRVGRVSI